MSHGALPVVLLFGLCDGFSVDFKSGAFLILLRADQQDDKTSWQKMLKNGLSVGHLLIIPELWKQSYSQ